MGQHCVACKQTNTKHKPNKTKTKIMKEFNESHGRYIDIFDVCIVLLLLSEWHACLDNR